LRKFLDLWKLYAWELWFPREFEANIFARPFMRPLSTKLGNSMRGWTQNFFVQPSPFGTKSWKLNALFFHSVILQKFINMSNVRNLCSTSNFRCQKLKFKHKTICFDLSWNSRTWNSKVSKELKANFLPQLSS